MPKVQEFISFVVKEIFVFSQMKIIIYSFTFDGLQFVACKLLPVIGAGAKFGTENGTKSIGVALVVS